MNKFATKIELGYDAWMKEIDHFLAKRIGLTQNDLADWLSYDTWESGASVQDGLRECLLSQDMFSDDDIEHVCG